MKYMTIVPVSVIAVLNTPCRLASVQGLNLMAAPCV